MLETPTGVCIAGVGMTDFSKNSGRTTTRLAIEATLAALRDAGIPSEDVDGLVPYPMGPTAEDLMVPLGCRDVRFTATANMGGASAVAGVRLAAMAVAAGEADVVVVFAARNGRSGTTVTSRVRQLAGQEYRQGLEYPHGVNTPAQWYSLMARRHMHDHGLTREALGTVAVTMREHAQLNPHAQMYGRPLTMDEYLASEPIADPYLKYDCCLETDGAAAVVVTSPDRLGGDRPLVRLVGSAEGHPRPADDIVSRPDLRDVGLTLAAPRAFDMAGLTPADVDVALIYDCFTFEVIQQLEEAGFCARGEGGDFVLAGNIGLGGSLPVNPHGGLLSEGHVVGLNHVVEAVVQLRDEGGERQVRDARVAAVTGWGDLGDGAILLLQKESA